MRVLVASKSVEVFEALRAAVPDDISLEIESELFSDQVAQVIPGTQLVIIDFEDVVEYPYEIGMIQALLSEGQERRKLVWTTSEDFLADPKESIDRASLVFTEDRLPDKLVVAFASYSGGVGKTMLALDTALHFHRCTGHDALLVEFVHGVSALIALTGLETPFLWDLASDFDIEPKKFRGVTLVPMDYENCSLLPMEQFARYLKRQMANHVLTVVDTIWPHGLIEAIQPDIDRWLVVTTPRVDAVENAKKLVEELGVRASIVLNQKRGTGDSLALSGMERELDLPYAERVDLWEGKLASQLLEHIYGPVWKQYEQKGTLLDRLKGLLPKRR
jgi:hypothetical protein